MSLTKNTQLLHAEITERNIATLIANALRSIHPDESSAVKRISRKTGIEMRTIEKWFQARNIPNTKHLLLLMHHYAEVRNAIDKFASLGSEEQQNVSTKTDTRFDEQSSRNFDPFEVYRVIYDPINHVVDSRNLSDITIRQLWFLNELRVSSNPHSGFIQTRWSVSKETAKRDIAKLRKLKLVRFVGAKRNGRYELA
ncbi:MAG: hypothetical protein P8P30_01305 [Rickettsiales bacterium]|nr:hypothetical protein [Rickettsiales bacterium]